MWESATRIIGFMKLSCHRNVHHLWTAFFKYTKKSYTERMINSAAALTKIFKKLLLWIIISRPALITSKNEPLYWKLELTTSQICGCSTMIRAKPDLFTNKFCYRHIRPGISFSIHDPSRYYKLQHLNFYNNRIYVQNWPRCLQIHRISHLKGNPFQFAQSHSHLASKIS